MSISISKTKRGSKQASGRRMAKPLQPDRLEPRQLLSSILVNVSGHVLNDVNDTGIYNASNPGLSGWTVYLDVNGNGVDDSGEPSGVTNTSGVYSFSGSVPQQGCYAVRVVGQSGWRLTYPQSGMYVLYVSAGCCGGCCNFCGENFEETQQGMITGTVFNDQNADGVQELGEKGISGLEVTVTDQSNSNVGPWTATTASNGNYTIRDLPGGDTFAAAVSNPPATDVPGWLTVQPGGGALTDGTEPAIYIAAGTQEPISFPEYRALPVPSDLTAVFGSGGTDHTTVVLNWTSNSNATESGFHVYESVNGGAYTLAATVGQGVTTDTITGLSTTSDYAFKVAAYDGNETSADPTGDSYLSNIADAAAPPAPSFFDSSGNPIDSWAQHDQANGNSVTLNWSDVNAPSGTSYNIYRSTTDVQPTTVYATSSTTSFKDTHVSVGSTYYYWIGSVSFNGIGASAGTGAPWITVPGPANTISYFEPIALQESLITNGPPPGGPSTSGDQKSGPVNIYIPQPDPSQYPNAQAQDAFFAFTSANMSMAKGLAPPPDYVLDATVNWKYTYDTIVNGVTSPPTTISGGGFGWLQFDGNDSPLPQWFVDTTPPPYVGAPSGPAGSEIQMKGDLSINICVGEFVMAQSALVGFYGITYTY